MAVDRCVCHSISFARLKELAEQLGPDAEVEKLAELTGATTGCGTCRPYIQWMLATGRTVFPVLPAGTSPPISPRIDRPGAHEDTDK